MYLFTTSEMNLALCRKEQLPYLAQDAICARQKEDEEYTQANVWLKSNRNKIIKVVNDQCINELERGVTGYTTVTQLKLLTRIWDKYRKIDTDVQLKEGKKFESKGGEMIDKQ